MYSNGCLSNLFGLAFISLDRGSRVIGLFFVRNAGSCTHCGRWTLSLDNVICLAISSPIQPLHQYRLSSRRLYFTIQIWPQDPLPLEIGVIPTPIYMGVVDRDVFSSVALCSSKNLQILGTSRRVLSGRSCKRKYSFAM